MHCIFYLCTQCFGPLKMAIFVNGCERLHLKISFEMLINDSMEPSKSKLRIFRPIDKVP